jgi:beta-glucosidase
MQARFFLLIGLFLFINTDLQAQNNGRCSDCPVFDSSGKVKIRRIKENITGNPSQPVSIRVQELISRMTLDEKIAQLVNESDSIPRLNLLSYNYWNECLHGVAQADITPVFPQSINLTSTWNPELVKKLPRPFLQKQGSNIWK